MDSTVVGVLVLTATIIFAGLAIILFNIQVSTEALILSGIFIFFILIGIVIMTLGSGRTKKKEGQDFWQVYSDINKFFINEHQMSFEVYTYVGKFFGGSRKILHAYILECNRADKYGGLYMCIASSDGQIQGFKKIKNDEEIDEFEKNPFKFVTAYEGSPVADFDLSKDLSDGKVPKTAQAIDMTKKTEDKKEQEKKERDRIDYTERENQ
jgi:hypothetical protein